MATQNVEQSQKTETEQASASTEESTVVLSLQKPKSSKKVEWTEDTVDNEHLQRKKSKCCCVYKKPHQFGESSSESEDECDHCQGHVEMKNRKDTNT